MELICFLIFLMLSFDKNSTSVKCSVFDFFNNQNETFFIKNLNITNNSTFSPLISIDKWIPIISETNKFEKKTWFDDKIETTTLKSISLDSIFLEKLLNKKFLKENDSFKLKNASYVKNVENSKNEFFDNFKISDQTNNPNDYYSKNSKTSFVIYDNSELNNLNTNQILFKDNYENLDKVNLNKIKKLFNLNDNLNNDIKTESKNHFDTMENFTFNDKIINSFKKTKNLNNEEFNNFKIIKPPEVLYSNKIKPYSYLNDKIKEFISSDQSQKITKTYFPLYQPPLDIPDLKNHYKESFDESSFNHKNKSENDNLLYKILIKKYIEPELIDKPLELINKNNFEINKTEKKFLEPTSFIIEKSIKPIDYEISKIKKNDFSNYESLMNDQQKKNFNFENMNTLSLTDDSKNVFKNIYNDKNYFYQTNSNLQKKNFSLSNLNLSETQNLNKLNKNILEPENLYYFDEKNVLKTNHNKLKTNLDFYKHQVNQLNYNQNYDQSFKPFLETSLTNDYKILNDDNSLNSKKNHLNNNYIKFYDDNTKEIFLIKEDDFKNLKTLYPNLNILKEKNNDYYESNSETMNELLKALKVSDAKIKPIKPIAPKTVSDIANKLKNHLKILTEQYSIEPTEVISNSDMSLDYQLNKFLNDYLEKVFNDKDLLAQKNLAKPDYSYFDNSFYNYGEPISLNSEQSYINKNLNDTILSFLSSLEKKKEVLNKLNSLIKTEEESKKFNQRPYDKSNYKILSQLESPELILHKLNTLSHKPKHVKKIIYSKINNRNLERNYFNKSSNEQTMNVEESKQTPNHLYSSEKNYKNTSSNNLDQNLNDLFLSNFTSFDDFKNGKLLHTNNLDNFQNLKQQTDDFLTSYLLNHNYFEVNKIFNKFPEMKTDETHNSLIVNNKVQKQYQQKYGDFKNDEKYFQNPFNSFSKSNSLEVLNQFKNRLISFYNRLSNNTQRISRNIKTNFLINQLNNEKNLDILQNDSEFISNLNENNIEDLIESDNYDKIFDLMNQMENSRKVNQIKNMKPYLFNKRILTDNIQPEINNFTKNIDVQKPDNVFIKNNLNTNNLKKDANNSKSLNITVNKADEKGIIFINSINKIQINETEKNLKPDIFNKFYDSSKDLIKENSNNLLFYDNYSKKPFHKKINIYDPKPTIYFDNLEQNYYPKKNSKNEYKKNSFNFIQKKNFLPTYKDTHNFETTISYDDKVNTKLNFKNDYYRNFDATTKQQPFVIFDNNNEPTTDPLQEKLATHKDFSSEIEDENFVEIPQTYFMSQDKALNNINLKNLSKIRTIKEKSFKIITEYELGAKDSTNNYEDKNDNKSKNNNSQDNISKDNNSKDTSSKDISYGDIFSIDISNYKNLNDKNSNDKNSNDKNLNDKIINDKIINENFEDHSNKNFSEVFEIYNKKEIISGKNLDDIRQKNFTTINLNNNYRNLSSFGRYGYKKIDGLKRKPLTYSDRLYSNYGKKNDFLQAASTNQKEKKTTNLEKKISNNLLNDNNIGLKNFKTQQNKDSLDENSLKENFLDLKFVSFNESDIIENKNLEKKFRNLENDFNKEKIEKNSKFFISPEFLKNNSSLLENKENYFKENSNELKFKPDTLNLKTKSNSLESKLNLFKMKPFFKEKENLIKDESILVVDKLNLTKNNFDQSIKQLNLLNNQLGIKNKFSKEKQLNNKESKLNQKNSFTESKNNYILQPKIDSSNDNLINLKNNTRFFYQTNEENFDETVDIFDNSTNNLKVGSGIDNKKNNERMEQDNLVVKKILNKMTNLINEQFDLLQKQYENSLKQKNLKKANDFVQVDDLVNKENKRINYIPKNIYKIEDINGIKTVVQKPFLNNILGYQKFKSAFKSSHD